MSLPGSSSTNARVVAIDPSGAPFTELIGDPIAQSGNFERTTREICAAIA